MAFNFLTKYEETPKPTLLVIILIISLVSHVLFDFTDRSSIDISKFFQYWMFLQYAYVLVNYKKIFRERNSSPLLSSLTISFVVTNFYLLLLKVYVHLYSFSISLSFMIISVLSLFIIAVIIAYIFIKTEMHSSFSKLMKIPAWTFSFPFYKYSGFTLLLLIPNAFLKSKVYAGVSLVLFVLGMLYNSLGDLYYTKRKDELDRLIKYESSYYIMQFFPVVILVLFSLEYFFSIKVQWFPCMFGFLIVHLFLKGIINRKYE